MFGSGHETQLIEIISEGLLMFQKLESFTTSKMDCHLLRQKLRQRISVMKTAVFWSSTQNVK